jgi:hypothetical protein
MRRSPLPASSCCTAFARDSSDWGVWVFETERRLQSGTRCFGPEVYTAQQGVLARASAICTRAFSGTKDQPDAGDRYRTLLPDCHFMFVYDAGRAIGAERPEALAYIALEFFERRDLFLVSRESGMAFP